MPVLTPSGSRIPEPSALVCWLAWLGEAQPCTLRQAHAELLAPDPRRRGLPWALCPLHRKRQKTKLKSVDDRGSDSGRSQSEGSRGAPSFRGVSPPAPILSPRSADGLVQASAAQGPQWSQRPAPVSPLLPELAPAVDGPPIFWPFTPNPQSRGSSAGLRTS